MPNGYNNRILRVELSHGRLHIDEPGEDFYRKYLGGRGLISYYLLEEVPTAADPLGPENRLVFAAGPVTGTPMAGTGRNSVGAKSPLTGGFGDAEAGGYWGAELKRAGFDAIIVEGRSDRPVYLSIDDGEAELRDASHLWGRFTADTQEAIRRELGDPLVRVAQVGPAGEKQVRFASVMNDVNRAAGRAGIGAVMGSKNLKAVAVRGNRPVSIAKPEGLKALARWLHEHPDLVKVMYDQGTLSVLFGLNRSGGLPTRNFREGSFEGWEKINGRALRDTMLVARRSCWACSVRCKREVKVDAPYKVDPVYGGPEYETIAAFGSNCGVDNLAAIALSGQLCNAYGMDTISAGASVAFAMECYQDGILSKADTGGIELTFGNADAMLEVLQMIGKREGLGRLLGEGVARAAKVIGRGADKFAMHVNGQEVPMHEPRWKQGMGLGYALSPTGADHCHNMHDPLYARPGAPDLESLKSLGEFNPVPVDDLGPGKVRLYMTVANWKTALNCLVFCHHVPLDYTQVAEMVHCVTGWDITARDLLLLGERCVTMDRIFNLRHRQGMEDGVMPERFFSAFEGGPLKGVALDRTRLSDARQSYYELMGWDSHGVPTTEKLANLAIPWVS